MVDDTIVRQQVHPCISTQKHIDPFRNSYQQDQKTLGFLRTFGNNICQRIAKSQTDDRRQDSKLKGLENNAHIRSFQEFAEILQGEGERQHFVSIFCKCI